MTIHVIHYYDEPDGLELVDVDYQCSRSCMLDQLADDYAIGDGAEHAGSLNLPADGSISWGAGPCGSETDYNVYCSNCGDLLWHGLESGSR
jgi:hypothetical protein